MKFNLKSAFSIVLLIAIVGAAVFATVNFFPVRDDLIPNEGRYAGGMTHPVGVQSVYTSHSYGDPRVWKQVDEWVYSEGDIALIRTIYLNGIRVWKRSYFQDRCTGDLMITVDQSVVNDLNFYQMEFVSCK